MSVYGLLNLGTTVSGLAVVTPSGSNYAPQPISFGSVGTSGISVNSVPCSFGPVSGSWGQLTCFGIGDEFNNPMWIGQLGRPVDTVNGQIITVPVGSIVLITGTSSALMVGGESIASNLVASGITADTAVKLGSRYNVFSTVVPSGAAILPFTTNAVVSALNSAANDLFVYPATGMKIDDGAPNEFVIVLASGSATFTIGSDITQCYSS